MEPDSLSSLAYVAGVERGRGRGNLGARESVWGAQRGKERSVPFLSPSRAPKFPLPLPLSTPSTQAISSLNFSSEVNIG